MRAAILGLILLLVPGCLSSIKQLDDNDVQRINTLVDKAEEIAEKHDVAYRVEVNVGPAEAYLKQSAGVSGVDARIIIIGNAGSN